LNTNELSALVMLAMLGINDWASFPISFILLPTLVSSETIPVLYSLCFVLHVDEFFVARVRNLTTSNQTTKGFKIRPRRPDYWTPTVLPRTDSPSFVAACGAADLSIPSYTFSSSFTSFNSLEAMGFQTALSIVGPVLVGFLPISLPQLLPRFLKTI
jgi:hypothetical protein